MVNFLCRSVGSQTHGGRHVDQYKKAHLIYKARTKETDVVAPMYAAVRRNVLIYIYMKRTSLENHRVVLQGDNQIVTLQVDQMDQ